MVEKILLLTPPYHTEIIEITGKWPPSSLAYLAGEIRKANFEVEIYDIMTKDIGLEEIKGYIEEYSPDVVMIGAFTATINAAIDTLAKVKEVDNQIVTCLGGVHPTFCYDEVLNENQEAIDYIIRGEGEITARELVVALRDGADTSEVNGLAYYQDEEIIITPKRELIADLDSLDPAWDLFDWEEYYYKITESRLAVISSSRGCDHTCSFCSQHKFWEEKYRARSPENLVEEIKYLQQEFGVEMCMFGDEYPTKDRERWERILNLLIEKDLGMYFTMETRVSDIIRDKDILDKYREAGFVHIYVGIESTKEELLEQFNKEITTDESKEALRLLNDVGIITECSFILGDIKETKESIQHTVELALEYNPDLAHFLLLTPWPYADIYDEVADYVVEEDYSKYHLVHPIIEPNDMSRDELLEEVYNCFKTFYMQKMKDYLQMEDSFKKKYMMRSIKILLEDSFLTEKLGVANMSKMMKMMNL
ncbi:MULTISPECIES: B12-binding domain-containing radical SAM protein [unclassified Candidatus Frackibacter]|uniref:B12-binding domain-containing radical SAM protein n=1 Tax=unclassified Candidatus Frackibacter TaxID=2648818 RepID=UPI000796D0E7|nr:MULTISPECIES: radical SAM protein [unclassified Candidatus Frackibacter]KXS44346.1 MAG: cobalamin B12-binding domain-containing protein [Candidatus Frackibacter sp. T328-2]SDC12016.1 anaerobic magnesium-protoporphyrin IX monomethyl ester cyclase [Candidatus Frackibacter sp. WG11]SEM36100.1 anaerobic magnesium-protoporphyrin IX monomethyl ester cyclase [Candidatus Frackibacter sp. WG12]SFL41328.1 anaerobic magnesium-protoporphyrin IX monomethyl ester cyclase [Candidatus Frackibacter sp. WG13]